MPETTHDTTVRNRAGDQPARVSSSDAAHPGYHFTAPTGWLNDPNGLHQRGGIHHLFYQYNPLAPVHGDIVWGHATSPDLVRWTDHPIALSPDADGPDADGCWSGVVVDDDGTPTIVYSAHRDGRELPAIARGSADLEWWTKPAANPVIPAPPGLDLVAFRDHCVWREGSTWQQLIGSGIRGVGGTALRYSSPDLENWTYEGPILIGDASSTEPVWTGTMWECVDLFELEGRHVLLFSAWDDGDTHFSAYHTGSYRDGVFTPDGLHVLDHGLRHFYAPQSFADESGRRIVIGWAQEGRPQAAVDQVGWSGVLSIPRVLSWREDGRLAQEPVPELTSYRRAPVEVPTGPVAEGTRIPIGGGAQLDIDLVLALDGAAACMLDVLADTEGSEHTRIVIDRATSVTTVDRSAASRSETDRTELTADVVLGDTTHVRVLVDHSLIEVFVDGIAITARAYPDSPRAVAASLSTRGGRVDVLSGVVSEIEVTPDQEQAS